MFIIAAEWGGTDAIGSGEPTGQVLTYRAAALPAEVARVQALGATVLEDREDYTILLDPGGLVFCVVPVQTGERFERDAITWA